MRVLILAAMLLLIPVPVAAQDRVPDFRCADEASARAAVAAAGLRIFRVIGKGEPGWVVVRQAPAPLAPAPANRYVDLWLGEPTACEDGPPVDLPTAAPPQAAPAPASRRAIPGDGIFIVGSDVAPGTYRTPGPVGSSCYYARLGGFSGELDDILANDNASGQAVVTIAPTDAAFETSDCQPWQLVGA